MPAQDLAGKLNEFLSDPESMKQLQNIAGMLGINSPAAGEQKAEQSSSGGFSADGLAQILKNFSGGEEGAKAPESTGTPAAGLSGGLSPEMLGAFAKLAPLLHTYNAEDDSTRLLFALRPLLSEKRQKKVDEAMRVLKMMRLLPLLRQSGVFSSFLQFL